MTMFSVGCDRITGTWAVDLRGPGASTGETVSGLSVGGPRRSSRSTAATTPVRPRRTATQVTSCSRTWTASSGESAVSAINTAALDAIVAPARPSPRRSRWRMRASDNPRRWDTARSSASRSPGCSRRRGPARGDRDSRPCPPDRSRLPDRGDREWRDLVRRRAAGAARSRSELDHRLAAAVAARHRDDDPAHSGPASVRRHPTDDCDAEAAAPGEGIAAIRPTGPVRGRGARPAVTWAPVSGAVQYQVVLLDARRRPLWAWQGTGTSVVVGGAPKPGPATGSGPRATKGSTWTVAALDAAGRPLGLSAAPSGVPVAAAGALAGRAAAVRERRRGEVGAGRRRSRGRARGRA